MKKKIAVEIKYQSKGTFPDRLIIGITGKLSAKQPIIGCWPYKTKKTCFGLN
jgi:hypothetical protein